MRVSQASDGMENQEIEGKWSGLAMKSMDGAEIFSMT